MMAQFGGAAANGDFRPEQPGILRDAAQLDNAVPARRHLLPGYADCLAGAGHLQATLAAPRANKHARGGIHAVAARLGVSIGKPHLDALRREPNESGYA